MQKLAVVYFLKINVDKIINLRRKYDPHWKIISPHITIVSPISAITEGQLIEHVENVINDIYSFSIHLTGLMKTSDDCLFLLVKEGNEKIINVYDRLYSGILTSYIPTDYPFVPHVTIGKFETKDNSIYTKAYKEAQDLRLDMTCVFDAVSVIKGNGITPVITIKTIKLQS